MTKGDAEPNEDVTYYPMILGSMYKLKGKAIGAMPPVRMPMSFVVKFKPPVDVFNAVQTGVISSVPMRA